MEIDNIFEDDGKKKRKKSGAKGKRHELEVVKTLNKRFFDILQANLDWGKFSRSAGSGNRWGQVENLPKHAKDTYSGDLTCPANFQFVLESKGGYNEIDLCSAFENGHREIDAFLKQSEDDCKRSGRKPMLVWKKDRKPRIAFVRTSDLPLDLTFDYSLQYRDWTGVLLSDLLEADDGYFFELG